MKNQLRVALEMKRNFYIRNLMESGTYYDVHVLRDLSFNELQRKYSALSDSQMKKTEADRSYAGL